MTIENRLQLSGVLILSGLAVQTVTLFWNHPLAFMAFLIFGLPLTLAGSVVYLYSLVVHTRS